MPLYTPIGGSWLNMAVSMQRILVRRGLSGQNPETTEQIIALLEGVAQGWNLDPTPFEWGGTLQPVATGSPFCRPIQKDRVKVPLVHPSKRAMICSVVSGFWPDRPRRTKYAAWIQPYSTRNRQLAYTKA